ncbi:preprotein translocase subunit SecG [Candidatus Woesebacteria bacterium RBG_16_34_12]|uniref:Protein-export membrane protein SecG n=1 Tax=Candidatus Woesebacteria bacterium RBG_16_34_12 TaxID=1802480 RepID=A0A1F7XDK5_9BACT|nr:MAG: preprotein translocase subunit SecG [Candidatus Woesebacteria bacterium RBG_16_34_12]
MQNILLIIQIISSIILVFAILIQSKGTGFTRSWKASSASFTRRGLEKIVFKLTFVITAIFLIVSILQLTI